MESQRAGSETWGQPSILTWATLPQGTLAMSGTVVIMTGGAPGTERMEARDTAQHPTVPGWPPSENDLALTSTMLRGTDLVKGRHWHSLGLLIVHTDWNGGESAGSASYLAESSPRPAETTPTHHPAMEVSRGWAQSTWSSLSVPPVWASTQRCTGSLEASRYSVELNTNMGSGSCVVPNKGANHDHGHFYCLALFKLGSRKWETDSY